MGPPMHADEPGYVGPLTGRVLAAIFEVEIRTQCQNHFRRSKLEIGESDLGIPTLDYRVSWSASV